MKVWKPVHELTDVKIGDRVRFKADPKDEFTIRATETKIERHYLSPSSSAPWTPITMSNPPEWEVQRDIKQEQFICIEVTAPCTREHVQKLHAAICAAKEAFNDVPDAEVFTRADYIQEAK
jgi:hypothetical protein